MEPRNKLLSGAEIGREHYALYISPVDIVNVLAFTPVWPEASTLFYSMAEMALLRMQLVAGLAESKLAALLFDAPIAYLGTGHYGILQHKTHAQVQREVGFEHGVIRSAVFKHFGIPTAQIKKMVDANVEVERQLAESLLGVPTTAPLECYAARSEWQKMFNLFYPGQVNDRVRFIRTRIDDYPHPFQWGDGMASIVEVDLEEGTTVVDFDAGDSGVKVYSDDLTFFYPPGKFRQPVQPKPY